MSEESSTMPKCPECGAPLGLDAPEGLCPRCLIALNLATETNIEEIGPNGTKVVKPSPATPPSPEDIARFFPQLEILECLGRGGMGVVYKARHPKLDRFVALKILAPEKEGDPRFADRFTREARALARLSHPNIVAVHDFGETDGLFYLIMEFVDGTNLRRLIQERKIAPEEALAIVPRICEALQCAHGMGIVHRDIKPENVLLARDGQVKIADFGIAKILKQEVGQPSITEDGTVGTPHYMAPEQVEQPKTVDHRADIYSLGVVFYEMLTGELPLGKFAPPSRKVQVDVRLDEVVLHALEKEPERRYQHASQVKTDVETIAMSAAKAEARPAESKHGEASGPKPAAASSPANLIASAKRQVNAPAIGLLITGILNWLVLLLVFIPVIYLRMAAAPPAVVSGASGTAAGTTWFGMGALVILPIALLPLLLGGFMIYAALKMRRLQAYPAAIIASVMAIVLTPANLVGLVIGIWALVVLLGKDVREAFRLVRSGVAAAPESSGASATQTSNGSAQGCFFVTGSVFLVGIMLVGLLVIGSILAAITLPAFHRARNHAQAVAAQHPGTVQHAHVAVEQVRGFGPIHERVLHQRLEGTTNWFLDLETGTILMPPPELAESLVRQELTSVPGTRAMQFTDWVKRTGVDVAVYGPDAFETLGGIWVWTHGATYEDWDDLDALTPEQMLASIRPREGDHKSRGRPQIAGVGWRDVLYRDLSVNYFFRTRDGALGVLQVVGRDEASGGLRLRYKLAEASRSSAAPQVASSKSERSFGPVQEATINDCDVQAEALDFETGRVVMVPDTVRQQLLEGDRTWFDESGVDLLVDSTRKGVGLITTRSNGLMLIKLTTGDWQRLFPAQLREVLQRDASGLTEEQGYFGQVYVLPTNAPTPVTLGFRTASGTEGVMQVSWPAGEQQPAIALRYKLVEASRSSAAPQVATSKSERSYGSVIETALASRSKGGPGAYLDLETGRHMNLPKGSKQSWQVWGRQSGVDGTLWLHTVDDHVVDAAFETLDVLAISVPENAWHRMSADELEIRLTAEIQSRGLRIPSIQKLKLKDEHAQQVVWLFKTRDDTKGMLKITGLSQVPPGLKLRYKLVERSVLPSANTMEATKAESSEELSARVQLMQPDPIRRYWRWRVFREPGARMVYGILDVTDPANPTQVLMGMEQNALTLQSNQDYTLRLNPEKGQWRIELEDAWAGENGGRGATWDKIRVPASATLDAVHAQPFGELNTKQYHVFWEGELTSGERIHKRLRFVGRLARADDPVQNLLDSTDHVREFGELQVPKPALTKAQTNAPVMRKNILLLPVLLIGLVIVLLVFGGAGWWIYAGTRSGSVMGRAALALAIGGLPLTAILVVVLANLGVAAAAIFIPLFLAFQIPAFALGLLSRRTGLGKAAMIVSATLLVISLVFVI